MKICKNCKHFEQNGKAIWYNQFCKAVQLPEGTNPVDGVKGYIGKNDLGGTYYTDNPNRYCRDVNQLGICEHFEGATP